MKRLSIELEGKGLGSAPGTNEKVQCTVLYCTVLCSCTVQYHAVVPVLLLRHRDDPDD